MPGAGEASRNGSIWNAGKRTLPPLGGGSKPVPPPLGPNGRSDGKKSLPPLGPNGSIWDAGKRGPLPPPLGPNGRSDRKKSGGLLSKIGGAGKGLLSVVGSALSAPQQIVFKGAQAANDVSQGEFGAAGKALLGAVAEAATLGQAGGDIDVANALRRWDGDEAVPLKLPKGINTGVGLVADPLNFLTFGAGAAATNATKVAAKELGEAAATRLAIQGLKKGLTSAEKSTLRGALIRNAEEAGAKNAAKTADKQLKQLSKRARGGVGFAVPFTDIGGAIVPGTSIARAAEGTGLTAAREAVKASEPARLLGRALIPGRAVAEAVGSDAARQVLDAGSRRFAAEATAASDLTKRIEAGVKSFEQAAGRKFTATEDAIVHRALEAGEQGIATAIREHPALETLIRAGDDIRRTVTASQIEAGVLDPALIRDDATYLKRLLTPEAREAFDTAQKAALRSGSSVSGALRQTSLAARTIDPDATVEQINDAVAAAQAGQPIADEAIAAIAQKLPPGAKLFDESAVRSLGERGHSAARAVAAADYVRELRSIIDDTGNAILLSADDLASRAAEHGIQARHAVPRGWATFDLPKLGTFHAPAEVAAEVKRFMAVIGADDSVGKFDAFLRRWDRWWKVQVTASLPGGLTFSLRNARSNLWMMFADGMPAHYLADSRSLQKEVASALADNIEAVALEGVESVLKRELSEREWKLFDAARRQGILDQGFYMFDLDGLAQSSKQLSQSKVRKAFRTVLGTEGALAQKGIRLNGAIENHARLSHFLYSVDRFGDVAKAADRTKAVLFDYGRLTPLEQQRIKRVVPFYTFMRKNVPGQFRAFIENPARIALPEKVSRTVTAPLGEDAPEYQQRQGARVLKYGPLAGFVSIPERPLQSSVAAVEPLAQLAGAAIPGNQGPIEPGGGFGQAVRSLAAPMGGGPLGAAKALYQEGSGINNLTGYKLKKGETDERLLAAALPVLGRFPSLSARLPTAEERRKDRQERQKTLAEIAQILGIKVEPPTNSASSGSTSTRTAGASSIWNAGKRK